MLGNEMFRSNILSPRARYYICMFALGPIGFGFACATAYFLEIPWLMLTGSLWMWLLSLAASEAECPMCGRKLGKIAQAHPLNIFLMPLTCDQCGAGLTRHEDGESRL